MTMNEAWQVFFLLHKALANEEQWTLQKKCTVRPDTARQNQVLQFMTFLTSIEDTKVRDVYLNAFHQSRGIYELCFLLCFVYMYTYLSVYNTRKEAKQNE